MSIDVPFLLGHSKNMQVTRNVDRLIDRNMPLTVADLRSGERARVLAVVRPDGLQVDVRRGDTPVQNEGEGLVIRLLEIGFVPGEVVRIAALGPGGREPLAVRIGGTTFALRRYEAEHIRVERLS